MNENVEFNTTVQVVTEDDLFADEREAQRQTVRVGRHERETLPTEDVEDARPAEETVHRDVL